jgi:hypothetical protein
MGDSIANYNLNGALQSPMLKAHQTALTGIQATLSAEARKYIAIATQKESARLDFGTLQG